MNELENKKYHYLYQTTNLVNEKIYIGIHSTNNLNDNYLGSGKYFLMAVNKYGKNNFKKEILEYCNNRKELLELESLIVDYEYLIKNNSYNLITGGNTFKKRPDYYSIMIKVERIKPKIKYAKDYKNPIEIEINKDKLKMYLDYWRNYHSSNNIKVRFIDIIEAQFNDMINNICVLYNDVRFHKEGEKQLKQLNEYFNMQTI